MDFLKSSKGFMGVASLLLALIAYSNSQFVDSVAPEPTPTASGTAPQKVEKISLDYAQAHIELMRKRDEAVVNSF